MNATIVVNASELPQDVVKTSEAYSGKTYNIIRNAVTRGLIPCWKVWPEGKYRVKSSNYVRREDCEKILKDFRSSGQVVETRQAPEPDSDPYGTVIQIEDPSTADIMQSLKDLRELIQVMAADHIFLKSKIEELQANGIVS